MKNTKNNQNNNKPESWSKKVSESFGQLFQYHINPVFHSKGEGVSGNPVRDITNQVDQGSIRSLLR